MIHERALEELQRRQRELRQPVTEMDDVMKQFMLKQLHQQAPKTEHFTADVTFVKPQFFTDPFSLFSTGLHLGESVTIGSVYVENWCSIAIMQIQFGPNTGQGQPNYLVVNPRTWRRYPIPTGITSINVVSNADDSGTCVVILTTEIWPPDQGELV